MADIFEGFKDKAKREQFIEFIKKQTLDELSKGIVSVSILERAIVSYRKDELFEMCEGIQKAIKEWLDT